MTRARLGQNFLVDQEWQKKIVSYFEPQGHFGEIGPGRGALTQWLEKKYTDFFVFEKDEQLAAVHKLSKKYSTIVGDFLDWDFSTNGAPVENFSLIGNLPYESGTAMIHKIIERVPQVPYFVFLLQKEVVERLAAKSRTRDFGALTVHIQGQYKLEALDIIPPKAFSPAPQVDSQIVRGSLRDDRHPLSKAYSKFVQAAFSQKRKTLKNSLLSSVSKDKIEKIIERFGFSASVRAEEIEIDLWPKIFDEIKNGG